MNTTLEDLVQLTANQPVAITILAGSRHIGRLVSLGSASDAKSERSRTLSHPSLPIMMLREGDNSPASIDWESVKAIHFVKHLDRIGEFDIRFFDSAAIPPFLWIRIEFSDGEAIEGKIENSLRSIDGPFLMLYPLDEAAGCECVCIPRAAIANLQVITFRR